MKPVLPKLAALLITLSVVALGCGDDEPGSDAQPTTTTTTTTTVDITTSTEPTSTSSAETGETLQLLSYLFRNEKMAVVPRTVPHTQQTAAAALAALLTGPTDAEQAAGFSTNIPAGTTLNGVTISGTTATVDLSKQFTSGGGSMSMMGRVAQITYTVTQFPSVTSVLFRVDGTPLTTLGGEGLMLDEPQTRADSEDLQPAILVERPAWGDTVATTFTASGMSNTFEATHQLQVLGQGGAMLFDQHVTATSGTGTRGTWSQQVTLPAGTSGGVTLRVLEYSAKDGSPTNQVDVPLTVG